uniref:Uncharacterized protein n=1 Tax=Hyaloperonospora arabidopsidis (strain Emoy2) TaxID=559515 RepID=M4BWG6_HYAAE
MRQRNQIAHSNTQRRTRNDTLALKNSLQLQEKDDKPFHATAHTPSTWNRHNSRLHHLVNPRHFARHHHRVVLHQLALSRRLKIKPALVLLRVPVFAAEREAAATRDSRQPNLRLALPAASAVHLHHVSQSRLLPSRLRRPLDARRRSHARRRTASRRLGALETALSERQRRLGALQRDWRRRQHVRRGDRADGRDSARQTVACCQRRRRGHGRGGGRGGRSRAGRRNADVRGGRRARGRRGLGDHLGSVGRGRFVKDGGGTVRHGAKAEMRENFGKPTRGRRRGGATLLKTLLGQGHPSIQKRSVQKTRGSRGGVTAANYGKSGDSAKKANATDQACKERMVCAAATCRKRRQAPMPQPKPRERTSFLAAAYDEALLCWIQLLASQAHPRQAVYSCHVFRFSWRQMRPIRRRWKRSVHGWFDVKMAAVGHSGAKRRLAAAVTLNAG